MTDDDLPAGRELDATIVVEVLGRKRPGPDGYGYWELAYADSDPSDPRPAGVTVEVRHYSTYAPDSWWVLAKMFADGYTCHTYGCKHTTDAPWAASFAKGPTTHHASAQTVEHAICRAALKAKRAEVK